jgi:glyoxylase-like metal-dependent hydrolase (beta-lactamase superfamily II)
MTREHYCLCALECGEFALDGGAMFGVIPKILWQKFNPADDANRIQLALRTLLLIGSEKKILIDTGIGTKFDKKRKNIYKIDHSNNNLEKSLRLAGIQPAEITDVIFSHLHFDHCGGTTFYTDTKLNLRFPNAVHHVQREQWEWANSPSPKDRASFIHDNIQPLINSEQLNLLSGDGEIFPGVESLTMNGHTPAMQLIKINHKKQTVLFCSDLIPTGTHISLPWVMAYDNQPLDTIHEKKYILPLALKNDWLLFFEHDPFRAAGTINKTERGYILKDEMQTSDFNKTFG